MGRTTREGAAMNAPFELAHSPFGGSVAARVLHCPASVGLVAKGPAHLRRPSAYADRGTALHAAITLLLDEKESLESLVGKTLNNYTITRDDVENALRPAFAYIDALLTPEAEFYLEHRVVFPAVAGAFGTPDLIVRSGDTIRVVDLMFGAGVHVLALYPDGDEDVLNAPLMSYAAPARHSLPDFFAGVKDIILTIVQPASIEPHAEMVSTVAVTHAELDEFGAVYPAACEEALSNTPRLERGTWCRFCPAKPICPAHTGPLFDLAQFAVPTPVAFAAPPAKEFPPTARQGVGPRRCDQRPAHDAPRSGKACAGEWRSRARLHALGRPRRASLARRREHHACSAGKP